MAQEPLKQWNSKLPESLIDELKIRSTQENSTVTNLLIKAIKFYLSEAPVQQSSGGDGATYENRLKSVELLLVELQKKL